MVLALNAQDLLNKRIAVLGAGRSGIAAVRLLIEQGAVSVSLADAKAPLDTSTIPPVVRCFWGQESNNAVADAEIIVKSPGIPRSAPILAAKSENAQIISELELAFSFKAPEARVVAVTGTNGKTTTTAWVEYVLRQGGINAVAGGNIGDAWCNTVTVTENQSRETVFVIECSSFQLEDLVDFRPDLAILTNITPDHMDRYDDQMDNYVAAKANIAKNMRPHDTLFLNELDAGSAGFAPKAVCRREYYSHDASTRATCSVNDGDLILDGTVVGSLSNLKVEGLHNWDNAAATALVCRQLDVNTEMIWKGLTTFPGVEHRQEVCADVNGVRYINDSKATNLDAAQKALESFRSPLVWIAGGRDAHNDYHSVSELVRERVKHLIALGEARELFREAYGELVPVTECNSMMEAVMTAKALAFTGDVILFSPACKSFDMYSGFEERGMDFKKCVAEATS